MKRRIATERLSKIYIARSGCTWFHKFAYKVSLLRLHSYPFLHVRVPPQCMCPSHFLNGSCPLALKCIQLLLCIVSLGVWFSVGTGMRILWPRSFLQHSWQDKLMRMKDKGMSQGVTQAGEHCRK